MHYKLSSLYQLVIDTRINAQLPSQDEYANSLTQIQDAIISAFEEERLKNHPPDSFREFINDHYLSLVDYQEKLIHIREPYKTLVMTCVTDIKDYMLRHFHDILHSSSSSEITIPPNTFAYKLMNSLRTIFQAKRKP